MVLIFYAIQKLLSEVQERQRATRLADRERNESRVLRRGWRR